jgi:hypothetical protein
MEWLNGEKVNDGKGVLGRAIRAMLPSLAYIPTSMVRL